MPAGSACLLVAHVALAGAAAAAVPPIVQLQRAWVPTEIISIARRHADSLASRHIAEALWRAAGALKQPRCASARASLAASGDVPAVLEAIARDAAPSDVVNLLRAAALLGIGPQHSRAHALVLDGVAHARGCCEALTAGEVTAAEWAITKLGESRADCPLAIRARDFPFRAHADVMPPAAVDFERLFEQLRPHLRREQIELKDSKGTRRVPESRLTAWLSDSGRSFLYSGKAMEPTPLRTASACVADVRESVHAHSGIYYDSVLVNYYAHGKVGMRYHQDPDQGTLWSTDTHVVSFGCARTFVLRKLTSGAEGAGSPGSSGAALHHEFVMQHGDCMHMHGRCQLDYQHCVRVERGEEDAGPRISLVFKKSLQ